MNIPPEIRAEITACLAADEPTQTATPLPEYLMRFWSVPERRSALLREFNLSPEQKTHLESLHLKLAQSDPDFARGLTQAAYWTENFQSGVHLRPDSRHENPQA